jgi:hypothetical protein
MRVSLVRLRTKDFIKKLLSIGAGYFKQFGNQFITEDSNYDKSSGIYFKINFKMTDIFLTLQYKF